MHIFHLRHISVVTSHVRGLSGHIWQEVIVLDNIGPRWSNPYPPNAWAKWLFRILLLLWHQSKRFLCQSSRIRRTESWHAQELFVLVLFCFSQLALLHKDAPVTLKVWDPLLVRAYGVELLWRKWPETNILKWPQLGEAEPTGILSEMCLGDGKNPCVCRLGSSLVRDPET